MKPEENTPEYFEYLEKEFGLKARRAAESAYENSRKFETGEISFADALQNAFGATNRPGQISGR
jgi:hypothetical protein